jgi:hypothetical protein
MQKLRKIHFVPPMQGQDVWRDKGVLVAVDVAKLDKAWRYNRVPKGGGQDPDTRFQYEGVKHWVCRDRRVELWATTVTREDDEEDALCFVEGRHSFAVLRDLGYKTIKVWVHENEVDELRRRYGAK